MIHSRITNYIQVTLRDFLYPLYNLICINKLKTPQKVIFLLSHMRAGSTLCINLLCTHPEIIGMGESGISYSSVSDFKILRGKIYSRRSKLIVTEKYLLDKLDNNPDISNPEILLNDNIKCIFLLRDAESTLSSILNKNFIKLVCPKQIESEKWASYYYQTRLAKLIEYAKIIDNKERSLYFTYEQLIVDTQKIFKALKQFLDLQDNFSENYLPLSNKGFFGSVGDPVSEKITSGSIIRKPTPKILLPQEILQKCLESYQSTNATLLKYCRCINENQC